MPDTRPAAIEFAQQNPQIFLNDLTELLRIPSISTSPEHKSEMLSAASNLANLLQEIGVEHVKILHTPGNPVVYGDWMNAGASAPIVLVYGHYDVQPSDPIDLWQTDPFSPEISGDYLFARGASDMKGQVIAVTSALRAILHNGPLPVNVKFLLEGEEEIGSPNLRNFIEAHKELFAATIALNPDAGMVDANTPTIVYALRGLAYFELRVYGPSHDLHSGLFGGVVHNPAQVLCELIAGMHDGNGTITLPGFYKRVRTLTPEERDESARLPMNDAYFLSQTGVSQLWGEKEFTPAERVGARPTLEVNGLFSGFTGSGSKTVLPAYAMAKISMRLVADQDPKEVEQQFIEYLTEHAPATIRWEISTMSGNPASAANPHSVEARAFSKALETVWGVKPVFKREGGSVPVVTDMQKILGIDSVLTGFGLPDDRIHSPNERLHLPTWKKGIEAMIHFFYNLAESREDF
jgi:acetylornithine deacetylase/succinyl-diaminopimelate desuccinylase-like protein